LGEKPNHTTARKILYKSFNTLWLSGCSKEKCLFLRRPENQAWAIRLEETSKIPVYDSLCGLAGGLGAVEGCRDGSVFVIICVCGTGACSFFLEIHYRDTINTAPTCQQAFRPLSTAENKEISNYYGTGDNSFGVLTV
jgi:hypothetical protein